MSPTPRRQNNQSKRSDRRSEIAWTTEIARSHHRWWWYVILSWVGLSGTLMAIAQDSWTVAAVISFSSLALLTINVGKPRIWRVQVNTSTIRVRRPSHPRFSYSLPLGRYRAFTIVEMPAGKRDRAQSAVALLPARPLGRPQLLVLPYSEHEADLIVQQLADVIPCEPSNELKQVDRALERLARWIGLS